MRNDYLTEWQKMLDGRRYNASLDPPYNDSVNLNIDMYNGNQWKNVEANGMPTPVFNIIKRAITFLVAMITSSKLAIKLKPLEYADKEEKQTEEMAAQQEAAEIANGEIDNLFEKFKMDNRIRDALFKAAQMGDVYGHLWFDMSRKPYGGMLGPIKGEICFELLNGTNVFLGNPNNPVIDKYTQPYVIVTGREMVATLKREAMQYKKAEIESLTTDTDYQYEAGEMAQIEIAPEGNTGKALYMIMYRYDPDKDTIIATKCTASAYMFKDVDMGLDNYPVAGMCWEKQENQYHGRALCTDIIPNQIYINRQFAMVMYHLMNAAFPKRIYNADKISGITNMIAGSIGVKGLMPGESVMNHVGQLTPGSMSAEIISVIEMAIQYTKEMLGINDSALGNVNPEQASGVAIAQTVRQASIPVENPKSNLYEFMEDIARICVDIMATNYGERPIIVNIDGVRQKIMYDFSVFKQLWLSVKCDVGPSTFYSETAQVQMLDNLLNRNDPLFQMIDYLETLPKNFRNEELIDRVKANLQEQLDQQQMQANQEQEFEQMAAYLETLPPEIQQQILNLPEGEQEAAIVELMQGGNAQ